MLKSQFVIRHATEADLPELHQMQERSFRVLGGSYYSIEEIDTFISKIGTMDDAVVTEGHYFVAVTSLGSIVASAGWSQLPPRYAGSGDVPVLKVDEAIIRSVFVDPSMPRRGLGSAVLRHTEADAAAHSIRSLSLTATLSGISFYRTLGYQDAAPGEIYLGAVRVRFLKMEKMLDADQVSRVRSAVAV